MTRIATYCYQISLCLAVQLLFAGTAKASPGKCAKKLTDVRFSVAGWKTDFCKHSVPLREIRSGGPPRDGIPPIDNPKFLSVSAVQLWLRPREPVISVVSGADARAYPLQVLIWHEIVNDTIGKVPIAVTFCPLCYAAIVFVRPTIGGKILSFGTSGNLRDSDMVMWDRQTESWWQQFTGDAIVGRLTGTTLTQVPAAIVSWEQFARSYPNGRVLSKDTGHVRAYGSNPYTGYDDISSRPFLFEGKLNKKMPPMAHVIGVNRGPGRAYPRELLKKHRVIQDQLAGESIVLFWKAGATSAVDKRAIADSRDLGMVGVFVNDVDGRPLQFTALANGRFQDQRTKSQWTVMGVAVSGKLRGKKLTPITHHNVFWFVWSTFIPKGTVYTRHVAGKTYRSPH